MSAFKVGDRVKCICCGPETAGRIAQITDLGIVEVRPENGDASMLFEFSELILMSSPDALYVPNHNPQLFNDCKPCSCDIVSLLQKGCDCGGK